MSLRSTIFMTLLVLACCGPTTTLSANTPAAIYDADPQHPWNVLHDALWTRTDRNGQRIGDDSLDPLRWAESKHLRIDPSRAAAIAAADVFLDRHAETLITQPLARLILTRDLWSILDALGRPDPRAGAQGRVATHDGALRDRLTEILRRVALNQREIDQLADNYAEAGRSKAFPDHYDPANPKPFLPTDLFDETGPWVLLGNAESRPLARLHNGDDSMGGRSTFLVYLNIPGGHEKTLDYLKQIGRMEKWPDALGQGGGFSISVPAGTNPVVLPPQFPAGTQVALVRQMLTIDSQGELRATHITESVQLRVYVRVRDADHERFIPRPPAGEQALFEFQLSRSKLLTGGEGGLRAIAADEQAYSTFQQHGVDQIEETRPSLLQPVLNSCIVCHSSPGIYSLLSFSLSFQPGKPVTKLTAGSIDVEQKLTIATQRESAAWKLLQTTPASSQPGR